MSVSVSRWVRETTFISDCLAWQTNLRCPTCRKSRMGIYKESLNDRTRQSSAATSSMVFISTVYLPARGCYLSPLDQAGRVRQLSTCPKVTSGDVADLEGTLSVRKAMITPLTGLFRHLEWTISVHSKWIATFDYQWSFRILLSDIHNMEFVTEIWKKWQPSFLNHEVMHPGPLCIFQWWATTGRTAHRRSLASLRWKR